MGYKVQIDALNTFSTAVRQQVSLWQEELEKISNKLNVLIQSQNIEGAGADSIKEYLLHIHMKVIESFSSLITMHGNNCNLYKTDYSKVDSKIHAAIIEEDLWQCIESLNATKVAAINIEDSLSYVLRTINDIFYVWYRDVSNVDQAHTAAVDYLKSIDESVKNVENTHYNNDFSTSEETINRIRTFIAEFSSKGREYATNFNVQQLVSSEVHRGLVDINQTVQADIESKAELLEEAKRIEEQYVSDLEQEKRQKIADWIIVGVAVVGAAALIVATAGAAGPGVCAVIGAVSGMATAAAENMTESYVNTGSLEEVDLSELAKDMLIGGVTGAISGYAAGASSMGSAIKQPVKAGLKKMGFSVLENVTEGTINTTWDVGEAIIQKKPGDEVIGILKEDAQSMIKDVVIEGATSFVSGTVSGKFDVDTSKKGFLKQFGESTVENLAEVVTEEGVTTVFDIGEAVNDPNSSKSLSTILKEETTDFLSNAADKFVEKEVSSLVTDANKSFKQTPDGKKFYKDNDHTVLNIVSDAVGETAGDFLGGTADQMVEKALGERENINLKDVWEENMEGGRNIVESVSKSTASNVTDHLVDDKEEFSKKLKIKDYDHDGKVETVSFDNYKVLKEDYDAAYEVAGKGAYKDKSVQDILGLPKNAAVSKRSVETSSFDLGELQKSTYGARKSTNATKVEIKPPSTQNDTKK